MSFVLQGIDFGPVHCASGAQGWFGEGYWFHRWVPGLDWTNCAFVAKTTTLAACAGNMPLAHVPPPSRYYEPRELFPKCIVVKLLRGVILNSVGLSGPGAYALFETGRWQKRTEPFFLSFMSVADSAEERYNEAAAFAIMLEIRRPWFAAPFGLQVNLSCPNAGHAPAEIAAEAESILGVFQQLRASGVPIVPKFNVLSSPDAVQRLQGLCDAVCVSNTIPWGMLPERIRWSSLFPGSQIFGSPLAHLGGGGLSGRPLLPLVAEWVREAKRAGLVVPVSAGGGILHPMDVDFLVNAGADSVFLGSIAMLRGWRLSRTIQRAHERLT